MGDATDMGGGEPDRHGQGNGGWLVASTTFGAQCSVLVAVLMLTRHAVRAKGGWIVGRSLPAWARGQGASKGAVWDGRGRGRRPKVHDCHYAP